MKKIKKGHYVIIAWKDFVENPIFSYFVSEEKREKLSKALATDLYNTFTKTLPYAEICFGIEPSQYYHYKGDKALQWCKEKGYNAKLFPYKDINENLKKVCSDIAKEYNSVTICGLDLPLLTGNDIKILHAASCNKPLVFCYGKRGGTPFYVIRLPNNYELELYCENETNFDHQVNRLNNIEKGNIPYGVVFPSNNIMRALSLSKSENDDIKNKIQQFDRSSVYRIDSLGTYLDIDKQEDLTQVWKIMRSNSNFLNTETYKFLASSYVKP